ncbi:MAG TPA: DUF2630 family protein [Acidimicrobiales bacterium]|jgi:hypothetical protein|nr:DUF2630 family protein [Acidimicrobiales bacterium]
MSDPNGPIANLGDAQLVHRIDALVEEEHRLEREHAGDGLDAAGRTRLEQLEVQLDQAWDLLRQRRARRHAGQDPDEAEVRSADVVEHYQQ